MSNTDAQPVPEGEIDNAQVERQPEGLAPESSAGSEDNHEQKHDGVQKRINQLTAEKYQAKREAEELQKRLAELEAKQGQQVNQATSEAITPPKLPDDMYDEQAMQKYHQDMTDYSRRVAEAAASSSYEQRQKQEAERQSQSKQSEIVNQYAQNALRDGVDLEKLRVAEQTLNQAGLSAELGNYIMRDSNGGKIAEYLHDNPALMHEVLSMDPVSAGIKIANEIKPQALSTTPKVTQAPDPTPDLTGGGFVEKDEFEREFPNAVFK